MLIVDEGGGIDKLGAAMRASLVGPSSQPSILSSPILKYPSLICISNKGILSFGSDMITQTCSTVLSWFALQGSEVGGLARWFSGACCACHFCVFWARGKRQYRHEEYAVLRLAKSWMITGRGVSVMKTGKEIGMLGGSGV
jgi:hypothetical protein